MHNVYSRVYHDASAWQLPAASSANGCKERPLLPPEAFGIGAAGRAVPSAGLPLAQLINVLLVMAVVLQLAMTNSRVADGGARV